VNRKSERIPRRFCLTAVLRGLQGALIDAINRSTLLVPGGRGRFAGNSICIKGQNAGQCQGKFGFFVLFDLTFLPENIAGILTSFPGGEASFSISFFITNWKCGVFYFGTTVARPFTQ